MRLVLAGLFAAIATFLGLAGRAPHRAANAPDKLGDDEPYGDWPAPARTFRDVTIADLHSRSDKL